MLNSIISIQNLTTHYHHKPVIVDLSINFPQATMCGIVGPNGGGKTTLLKSILGMVKPVSGIINILNQPYDKNIHKIAYVAQKSSIDWTFPICVYDVVLMGRYGQLCWWQRPNKIDFEIVDFALQQVEMTQYAHRQISELSGGEQQRIFLARALAQQADIFMLDEPFAGIDIVTESLILKVLQQLQKQGKSIIVVHHDIATVQQYFDWTLLINVQKIASGATSQTLTKVNLEKTFKAAHDSF